MKINATKIGYFVDHMAVYVLLFIAVFLPLSSALIGLDVSQRVLLEQFQCLREHDYQLVIVRLYRGNGVVDWSASQNILNARMAGFQRIEAYFLPCRFCDEPTEQMIEALEYLKDENVEIDRLWIDVGGRWTNDTESNVAFLESLIQPLESYRMKFGISTTRYRWLKSMSNTTKFAVNTPLWYSNLDDQKSFDDFQTFAGWMAPVMKQYRVDVKECGVVFNRNFA